MLIVIFFPRLFRRTICILPNMYSDKHDRYLYTNFKNPDPQEYDYIQSTRYFFMMLEYMLETEGTFNGLVLTLNSVGMNWRHITKTPMNVMKKLLGFVQVSTTDIVPFRFPRCFLRTHLFMYNALHKYPSGPTTEIRIVLCISIRSSIKLRIRRQGIGKAGRYLIRI